MPSLIAVKGVLRAWVPDAGTKPLFQLIKQGSGVGILPKRQAEHLTTTGRPATAWRTARPRTR